MHILESRRALAADGGDTNPTQVSYRIKTHRQLFKTTQLQFQNLTRVACGTVNMENYVRRIAGVLRGRDKFYRTN